MKNTKMCPKCNSQEIIEIPGSTGAYGTGNNIRVGMTVMSAVPVNRYLCCNCGYSEEWIDQEDISLVKKHYS